MTDSQGLLIEDVCRTGIATAIVKQGLENVRLYGDMKDPLYKVFDL